MAILLWLKIELVPANVQESYIVVIYFALE